MGEFVMLLERARLGCHLGLEPQQLANQLRDHLQDGDVVGKRPVTHADAVAGQQPRRARAVMDGHRDERDRSFGKVLAPDRARQETRLLVDVLYDDELLVAQRQARDAFPIIKDAAPGLFLGQAIGIMDAIAAQFGIVEHDPAAVEAQQLGQQVQDLAHLRGDAGAMADIDPGNDLVEQVDFLGPPVIGPV
jgi:hypothetical protein